MMKYWQYGTAEPNWMINNISGGWNGRVTDASSYIPGYIVIGGTKNAIGDTFKLADIRITPVPRTGGP
jgi:hypothetical protein